MESKYVIDIPIEQFILDTDHVNIRKVSNESGFNTIDTASLDWINSALTYNQTMMQKILSEIELSNINMLNFIKYIEINNTISKYKNKLINKEITPYEFNNLMKQEDPNLVSMNELIKTNRQLSKYSDQSDFTNATAIYDEFNKIKQKSVKKMDMVKNNIENLPLVRLKVHNVQFKNFCNNKQYDECVAYFRKEFSTDQIYLIVLENGNHYLYVYDNNRYYYLENNYDTESDEIIANIYDENYEVDKDDTLFIKGIYYTQVLDKKEFQHDENNYVYGYNYIYDLLCKIIDNYVYYRDSIKLMYYFSNNKRLITYIMENKKWTSAYGAESLRIFYNNRIFLNNFNDCIENPKTLYCSFRDAGDNIQTSRNMVSILDYTIIDSSPDLYEQNDFISDFPIRTSDADETLLSKYPPETIRIDNKNQYMVLGRTVYEIKFFDVPALKKIYSNFLQKYYIRLTNKSQMHKLFMEQLTTENLSHYQLIKKIDPSLADSDVRNISLYLCSMRSKKDKLVYLEAYKLKKQTESINTLLYEIDVMNWISNKLSHVFPYIMETPVKLIHIPLNDSPTNEIIDKLSRAMQLGKYSLDDKYVGVNYIVIPDYVNNCEPPSDYLKYLEDCLLGSCREFTEYSIKGLKQSAELINHNLVHSSLVSLFHNLEHARMYLATADFLNLQMHRFGMGRMNAILESAKYSNMRYIGLADFAEIMPKKKFTDLVQNEINKTNPITNYYKLSLHPHRLSELEMLSNQFLSWFVIVAKHIYRTIMAADEKLIHRREIYYEKSIQRVEAHVQTVLYLGMVHFLMTYLNKSQEDIIQFIKDCQIIDSDFNKISKQLSYFLSYKYVDDFSKNIINTDLYDDNTKILCPETLTITEMLNLLDSGKDWNDIAHLIARGWVEIVIVDDNNKPLNIIHLGWIYSLGNKHIFDQLEASLKIKFEPQSIILDDSGTLLFLNVRYVKEHTISDDDGPDKIFSLDFETLDKMRFYLWDEMSEYIDAGAVNGSLPYQHLCKVMQVIFPYAILKKYNDIDPVNVIAYFDNNIQQNLFVRYHLDLMRIVDHVSRTNDYYNTVFDSMLDNITDGINNLDNNLAQKLLPCVDTILEYVDNQHIRDLRLNIINKQTM